MTAPNQTPHFPCGPCPVTDEVWPLITHYRIMLQNLRNSYEDLRGYAEKREMDKTIDLVTRFLEHLWLLYHVAKETLKSGEQGVE